MRGVDQRVDAFGLEIGGESLRAAEAADPHRNRLRRGRGGAARKRQGHLQVGALAQQSGQVPRFRRAAEYENLTHVVLKLARR